jgi:arabinose-5-phosphate isomerase
LDKFPVVEPKTFLKKALEVMTVHRLGVVCVVDKSGRLEGVFTDGDVRRMLLKDQKPFSALFADDIIAHANRTPTTVGLETSLSEAVAVMEEKSIWDLPVVGDGNVLKGLLHLHPAIKAMLRMRD